VKPSANQGSLFVRESISGWRAPEVFPEIDSRYTRIGFDTETSHKGWRDPKNKVVGVSLALEDGRDFYFPWGHLGGGNLDKSRVLNFLSKTLKGKTLVCAEAKHEIQMMRREGVDFEAMGCAIREVQYPPALLSDARRSFQLNDLAKDFLGREKIDLDAAKIWEMPASEVGPYAELDARLNLDLDTVYAPLIQEQDLGKVLQLEYDLIYCVCEMERNGVPLDVPKLARWRREAGQRWDQAVYQVHRDSGLKLNFNSPLQVAQLFDKLGLEYPKTAGTKQHPEGFPSFTDAFLSDIDHPLVQSVRRAKAVDSLRTKYLDKYWDALVDGYLHYNLHQLKANEYGTISGRFSSSSVNIQQVFDPERQEDKLGFMEWLIRELFLPVPPRTPGRYWWVKLDASQIEFRLFVHYSRSARLIKRFCEDRGVDFHQMVADLCRIKRKPAKNINFGKLFGMGREKMARQLGLPQDEADSLFDQYNAMFPETQELMNATMSLAKARGYVKTRLGRRARFPDGERLHSALNRVIQGSAADVLKLKLLEVYNNRKFFDIHKLLFTVHDDINIATQNLRRVRDIKECLEAPIPNLPFRVPILWDADVGPNWAVNYREKQQTKLRRAA
jgi:DNA polymerase-1